MGEQWDLTSRVSPYLDRHMMFPLLEFLDGLITSKQIAYPSEDIQAARLALLRPTKMKDYAMDILNASESVENKEQMMKELNEEKTSVLQQLDSLKEGCKSLQEICEKEDQLTKIKAAGQWNVAALEEHHGITKEMVDTYRQLARFKYDCGDYKSSRDMLTHYIALFALPPANDGKKNNDDDEFLAETSTNNASGSSSKESTGNPSMYYLQSVDQDMLQVLWGKLASEIMAEDWTAASKAVEAVRTAIESMVSNNNNDSTAAMSHIQALQQRTWLLHWALFVYWNDSANHGLEHLVELFHSDRYKQAITTHAPHLLRYLTGAVLLCKRRKKSNKDDKKNNKDDNSPTLEARRLLRNLVYVMQDCEYTDPIVDFVHSLLVKFDFEMAQTKLAECQNVLKTDFFLCHQTDLFMEEARVFLFENYCRIHHKIDLKALGFKFLAMDPADAERWMVDLIRHSDVLQQSGSSNAGAKVQDDDCIIMELEPQSIYEQVMDRTRDLNIRSASLAQSLQNRVVEAKKEKAKRERQALEEE
uniref:Eukaryotic translation initiation factor 3 subunit E n=1 Tax=Entomoneis paludosa TaxID=265537 RepID=A0A7S2YDF7_9STRA|mmetsp:Transcript_28475/g.59446  ORF Transcript_28475/g.59446 Transcript_28475/m.59446 type:complete len:531 (+) Transcript_28475:78-1670(+)|eukprot:CAMPEP_0172456918 /NCGR_PEP_ID=MMETSP1065-20121228/18595_1 /TAXON_ID=265537 /ORGANISM="Amphiprora paludosa, Strain CCMP125" /LENGTH=530 /DNA_ID=CAMNT_0013210253 /DNA_START=20 /DNA_END=1612 /DNA_ORIENTATION=+